MGRGLQMERLKAEMTCRAWFLWLWLSILPAVLLVSPLGFAATCFSVFPKHAE
jgi:hypothetical protein